MPNGRAPSPRNGCRAGAPAHHLGHVRDQRVRASRRGGTAAPEIRPGRPARRDPLARPLQPDDLAVLALRREAPPLEPAQHASIPFAPVTTGVPSGAVPIFSCSIRHETAGGFRRRGSRSRGRRRSATRAAKANDRSRDVNPAEPSFYHPRQPNLWPAIRAFFLPAVSGALDFLRPFRDEPARPACSWSMPIRTDSRH